MVNTAQLGGWAAAAHWCLSVWFSDPFDYMWKLYTASLGYAHSHRIGNIIHEDFHKSLCDIYTVFDYTETSQ